MMEQLFARYLEAGIFGSVVIVMVLLLRLCLRKAPRRILCLLWLLAAIRLLLPFRLESRISLQPDLDEVAVAVQQMQQLPQTQLPPVDVPVNQPIELPIRDPVQIPVTTPTPDLPVQQIAESVDPMVVLSIVWLSAAGAAILYMAVSYGLLKFRVREAVRSEDGVMECDRIRGAFLLGYIHPRIYLPFRVSRRDRGFIVAHERAHIARGDNWWKLLGFACAALHWYNPLVWFAYVLLCRDIELACDERVIRELDINDRKAYSMALLNCGKSLAGVSVCPVAFGEVSLKTRIKRVLHYRKPGVWITVIALTLTVATAFCFLTSPAAEATPPDELPETTDPTTEATEPSTEPTIEPTEPETVPEPTEHVHAYMLQTVAPTCTEEGYDLHICTCGDQFADNPMEVTRHQYYWAETRYYENKALVKCASCSLEYWETVPLNYNDTGRVSERLDAYAAAYGFNMNFTGSKSDAICFSYSISVTEKDDEALVAGGKLKIAEAYDYCIAHNLNVSEQMCYINVHYVTDGRGNGIDKPKTESTSSPQFPVIQWDIRVTPSSTTTSYTGASRTSSATLQYYVDVYIAPMPKEKDEEQQENGPTDNITDVPVNTDPTESAEPTEETTSTMPIEPTETTETTEPSESADATEPTGEID